MTNPKCVCPYLPCPIHGNCQACMEISLNSKSFPNCIENQVEEFGGCLERKYPHHTIICDDYEGMSQKSADFIAETLLNKPDALIALSAGGTTVRTYEILKEKQDAGKVDFSKARFIQLDEWLDLKDRSEDCNSFMHKHFYDSVGIRPDQIRAFDLDGDLDKECKALDAMAEENGGIDFVLLGIGMNGHVALLEPGELFDYGYHVVNLSDTTKTVGQKYFSDGMELTRGLTIGARQIFAAKKVVLQAGGRAKAEIIRKLYITRPQIAIPASIMALLDDRGVVVLDKDAASLLYEAGYDFSFLQ